MAGQIVEARNTAHAALGTKMFFFIIALADMQKIEDFTKAQGNGFIVPNDNTTLSLGYLDDNHDGNGYSKHDNGNDDQCKDVQPAALEIAVFHAPAGRG